jgi:hypothetical protein
MDQGDRQVTVTDEEREAAKAFFSSIGLVITRTSEAWPYRLADLLAEYRPTARRKALEDAEQRCRYMAKHNEHLQEEGDYKSGFQIACELCEDSIRAMIEGEG